MTDINLEKQHNAKTVNVVTRILGQFVGQVSLEKSSCCSESILIKVSDIVIYRTSKKLCDEVYIEFCRAVLEITLNILSKVALRRMARKQVSFQDRKKENTPKFPSIEK